MIQPLFKPTYNPSRKSREKHTFLLLPLTTSSSSSSPPQPFSLHTSNAPQPHPNGASILATTASSLRFTIQREQVLRVDMIELLPAESSAWSAVQSPRISFSHDFPNSGDGIPVDHRPLLDSNSDFRFFSGEPPLADDSYSRSADELFCNGRILPASTLYRPKPPAPPPPAPARETLREVMRTPELGSDESSSKPPTPQGSSSKAAFWRFGRSSSLNSYGGSKRSLLGKLPLLHRSNSTGSSNQTQKKHHNKSTPKPKGLPPPPPSSSSSSSSVSSLPKPLPPAKKAGAGFAGGRVNPVLNVPPPYISSGTTNLFGFGYFFRQSRECSTTASGKSRKKTTT